MPRAGSSFQNLGFPTRGLGFGDTAPPLKISAESGILFRGFGLAGYKKVGY